MSYTIGELIVELHRVAQYGLGYQSRTDVDRIQLFPITLSVALFDKSMDSLEDLEREVKELRSQNLKLEIECSELDAALHALRNELENPLDHD